MRARLPTAERDAEQSESEQGQRLRLRHGGGRDRAAPAELQVVEQHEDVFV